MKTKINIALAAILIVAAVACGPDRDKQGIQTNDTTALDPTNALHVKDSIKTGVLQNDSVAVSK